MSRLHTSGLKLRLAGQAMVVGVALIVGGCAASPAHALGVPGVTGHEILIGMSNPESGPLAVYSAAGSGMQAYFDYVNAKGGIDGYRFKTVVVDNGGTVTGGASSVRQLIADRPLAIEITITACFIGAEAVLKANPSVTALALASGATVKSAGLSNVFGLFNDYTTDSFFDMKYVVQTLGVKKVGLMYDPTLAAQSSAQDPAYVRRLGGSLAANVSVVGTETDFAPVVAQLRNAGVQAVVLMATIPEIVGFAKAAVAVGYSPKMVTYSGNIGPSVIAAGGAAVSGLYAPSLFPPLTSSDPAIVLFRKEVAKYAGSAAVNGISQIGWAAGAVVVAAVQKELTSGKTLGYKNFRSGLYALYGHMVSYVRVGLRPSAHYAIGAASSYTMYVVKNGRFVAARA